MQIKNAVYAQGAVKKEQYPESILPEIALFGRSNVGKSSLINSLINRKNLARTSAQPVSYTHLIEKPAKKTSRKSTKKKEEKVEENTEA